MRALVVAHPDDEVIWFDPLAFDLIVIAFFYRDGDDEIGENRRRAVDEHFLKRRIVGLHLTEPGLRERMTDKAFVMREVMKRRMIGDLRFLLKKADEVYTHNPWGEYYHDDHISVNEAVCEAAKGMVWCPTFDPFGLSGDGYRNSWKRTEKWDSELFESIKKFYKMHRCWTGYEKYSKLPNDRREYLRIK